MDTDIILFDKACLYDDFNNETRIYGLCKNESVKWGVFITDFYKIYIEKITDYSLVISKDNCVTFMIKIKGKILNIDSIVFYYKNYEFKKTDIVLYFPFENCNLNLNSKSAIISTMCKNYWNRLDEWINYNLKLGFSGIVIFNNDNIPSHNPEQILKKYYGKVWIVDFPYVPFNTEDKAVRHWLSIQRISFHIGTHAFKRKCRHIALIDVDEFVYIPKNPSMGIEKFLEDRSTITLRSNILTNKSDNEIINNNVLKIAKYLGPDKFTKTFFHTEKIGEDKFINQHHCDKSQTILEKDEIIHYHCWMNHRYKYDESMPRIDFLEEWYRQAPNFGSSH